jgi:tetrahydromethanopterin S-methyltransferase subunit C
VALIGFGLGAPALGFVAVAFALVAALLNASIGLCLGCELYLAWSRLRPVRA